MHSSLIGKVEKANRYARELDRISIERLALTFRGDNDTHHVSLDAGQWHCTCHSFARWGSGVHPLRRQRTFGVMLPEDAQTSTFSATAAPALAWARRPRGRRRATRPDDADPRRRAPRRVSRRRRRPAST